MANIKYFSDWQGATIEVDRPFSMANKEFAAKFPGVRGVRYDGMSMMIAQPIGVKPVWDGARWVYDYRPVTRKIEFKSYPSMHVCDARCMNARGRSCECSCGGKNHGAGSFACREVA
jgi:hypothetical protein